MVQSFNRVDDPILDQSGSKLLGAAAGGYGGWKYHNEIAKNRKGLGKLLGLGSGVMMRPLRTVAGAGLGALGAGVLARFLNKKHEDRQQQINTSLSAPLSHRLQEQKLRHLENLRGRRAENNMYDNVNLGSQAYDEVSDDMGYNLDKYSADNTYVLPGENQGVLSKALQGGLIGGLGSAMLGFSPVKGAGIGALGLLGHDLYKKHKAGKEKDKLIQQQLQPQQQQYQGYYPYG